MTHCCTKNLCAYYCLLLSWDAGKVALLWYHNKVSQHVTVVEVLVTSLSIIASTPFGHLESMPVMEMFNNYVVHGLLRLISLTLWHLSIVSLH